VILSNVEYYAEVTAVELIATINLAEYGEESYLGIVGIENASPIASQ
jgi:hypothetical protein